MGTVLSGFFLLFFLLKCDTDLPSELSAIPDWIIGSKWFESGTPW